MKCFGCLSDERGIVMILEIGMMNSDRELRGVTKFKKLDFFSSFFTRKLHEVAQNKERRTASSCQLTRVSYLFPGQISLRV